MHRESILFLFLGITLLAVTPQGAVSGQTFRYETWQFSQRLPKPNYNFKAGGLYFDLSGSLDVKYDDNINYSENNPVDDFSATAALQFDGLWEFSPVNSFSARIGIAYDKFMDNSQLDSFRVFLDSESELTLTLLLGEMTLQIYDRPAYNTDPADASFIDEDGNLQTELSQYSRFENEIGVRGFYDFNLFELDFKLARLDELPSENPFDFREREEILLQGRISRELSSTLSAGVGASYSEVAYKDMTLNDGENWSIGPFVRWAPSEYINLTGGLTWVEGSFERGGTIEDDTDTNTMNTYLQVNHLLNRYFSHRLSARYFTTYGFVTNSRDILRTVYSFNYELGEGSRLIGNATWEDGEDSAGLYAETYERIGFGLRYNRQIGPSTQLSLFANFSDKDSNVLGRSYTKTQVGLSLFYDF